MVDLERVERVMQRIEADPFIWFQGCAAVLKPKSKPRYRLVPAYNFAVYVLLDAGYEFVAQGEGPKGMVNGLTPIEPFVLVRPDGSTFGWDQVTLEAKEVLRIPDTMGYGLFESTIKMSSKMMRSHVDALHAAVGGGGGGGCTV